MYQWTQSMNNVFTCPLCGTTIQLNKNSNVECDYCGSSIDVLLNENRDLEGVYLGGTTEM